MNRKDGNEILTETVLRLRGACNITIIFSLFDKIGTTINWEDFVIICTVFAFSPFKELLKSIILIK